MNDLFFTQTEGYQKVFVMDSYYHRWWKVHNGSDPHQTRLVGVWRQKTWINLEI